MVIFGGIRDVIRELNDLHVYSFTNSSWHTIQEPAPSPRETSKFMTGGFTFSGGSAAHGNTQSSDKRTPNKNAYDSPAKFDKPK